ncbi:hypothetical protein [Chryseobacterium mucoviscidosis]|nr:hypothetical protein [Chryseobacterium mucoviscidosis]
MSEEIQNSTVTAFRVTGKVCFTPARDFPGTSKASCTPATNFPGN